MKTVTFKRKGLLWWLTDIFFNYPARDTCTYRGQVIGAVATAIICFPAVIVIKIIQFITQKSLRDDNMLIFLYWIIMILSVILGITMTSDTNVSLLLVYLLSPTIFILIMGTSIGSVYLLTLIPWEKAYLPRSKRTGGLFTQTNTLWNSFKDKVCFKIDWK